MGPPADVYALGCHPLRVNSQLQEKAHRTLQEMAGSHGQAGLEDGDHSSPGSPELDINLLNAYASGQCDVCHGEPGMTAESLVICDLLQHRPARDVGPSDRLRPHFVRNGRYSVARRTQPRLVSGTPLGCAAN